MTFFGKPGCVYAFGSVIDVRMNGSSGCFAWAAYCCSLSRSGPTLPVVPAAESVWQPPQGWFLNTAAPLTEAFGEVVAFVWLLSHLSKAASVMTITWLRIVAWPRPQSSVQMMS